MVRAILLSLLLLCSKANLHAQLCTGSLGDPIVNITFGAGGNPGLPLAAAATGYQFVTSDCPGDGFYTIRNGTSGCFGTTWHTLNMDHTGEANGYFMLVNASYTPGAFYIDTVRGLCERSNFELAAWIVNVLTPSACSGSGITPDISFSVEKLDGTVLQSYNTGNIPATGSPQWVKYGFFFTTPVGVNDVVLRIVNNAPGGCGNDLALDDITFRACGPQVTNFIDGVQESSVDYCAGTAQQYNLSGTLSAGFTAPEYQWQEKDPITNAWSDISGANGSSYVLSLSAGKPAGTYNYRLAVAEAGNITSQKCRIYSMDFTVTVHPLPTANAGSDKTIVLGQSTQLNGSVTPGDNFTWTPPLYIDDVNSLTPKVSPPTDQEYTLTAVSQFGCGTSTDRVFVKVFKDIYIPTAFTPNKDGLNDTWRIFGLDALPGFRLTVYGRWGQIVFTTTSSDLIWDGKFNGEQLPSGSYVYVFDTGISGKIMKGIVTIIR